VARIGSNESADKDSLGRSTDPLYLAQLRAGLSFVAKGITRVEEGCLVSGIEKTACRKFHDLRHTFANQFVIAGIDLTTIKELLGRKTLTMTLRYASLAPSHKVKAVDVMDNTINENSNKKKLYKQGATVNK
jgi:site-specific recombinase XerD